MSFLYIQSFTVKLIKIICNCLVRNIEDGWREEKKSPVMETAPLIVNCKGGSFLQVAFFDVFIL